MEKKNLYEIFRCRNCTIFHLLAICVLLTAFSGQLMAQEVNMKVTIHVQDMKIRDVISRLQKISGFHFVYEEKSLSDNRNINLNFSQKEFAVVLDEFCRQSSLRYEVKRNLILLSKKEQGGKIISQETRTLTGVVSDENGEPLPGVNLLVRTTQNGTVSDVNGEFSLTVRNGDVIDFTFIGMDKKSIKITSSIKKLRVMLETSNTALQDIIVTGYQTLSKERASGSFATVSSKDLESKLQTDLVSRLEGSVVGMTRYKNNLTIRGVSTLNGNETPLYIVDGVPYEGTIAAINPAEVTNVTVLKDAAAASIYGARSSNGVIVITTRGGSEGPAKVHYNGSIKFKPLYDTDYFNLMSSSEFVDFQQKLFNINQGSVNDDRWYMNEVRALLFSHKKGELSDSELKSKLDVYRHRDREEQVKEEFLRLPAITHQHNLSISGGGKKNNYALSLNYMKDLPYDKYSENDRMGFNLKNSMSLAKWVRADIRVLGSIYRQDANTGHSGLSYLTGKSLASYILYRDEEGNELPWYPAYKSQKELDRLVSIGLLDESYYPMQEVKRSRSKSRDYYLNLNASLHFLLTKDLTFDLILSKDFGNTYTRKLYSKDSHYVKNDINNAAQIKDGEIIYNIPEGGQINETRMDKEAYTVRAQVNYRKEFSQKHLLNVIAGAERRATKSKSTSVKRVGYDDQMLTYKLIDELTLSKELRGTEALNGRYTYSGGGAFSAGENRYVSFYGNASYTFDERATLTGSIRIDQSNLFGTDPKYQYRPLWSLGGTYVVLKNQDWIDRLAVRMTYGINGNIARTNGPYLTVTDSGVNIWTGEYSSKVASPDNQGLRWEKTAVFNMGVDFNLLKNRLSGSIEFYNKNTSDLLHDKTMDPTLGWTSIKINYGSMYNRGIEFSLRSLNFATKDFSWHSVLNFSYNKNKLTELEEDKPDAINYIQKPQLRIGEAMNTIYSVQWAGLDDKGNPQAYKKNGEIVKSFAELTTDDLVKSGVITPPYSASFSNDFRYKNFSLSLLFTYYGGHVMRGAFATYLNNTGFSTNQDRLTGNFWEKPGDENDPSKAPALKMGVQANQQNLWKAADKHVQKADYIKLNNITLGYSLPNSLLRRTFLKGVRVMLQIDDVWKWVANNQRLDPETWTGTGLSSDRGQKNPTTYTLGVSCNF